MKRFSSPKYIAVAVIIAVFMLINALLFADNKIENIADITYSSLTGGVVAVYEESTININRLNENGKVIDSISMDRQQGGEYVEIVDMLVDDESYLYVLTQRENGNDKPLQELVVYNFDRFLFKHVETHEFDAASDVTYRWLSLDGSLFISGTNQTQTLVTRESYDKEMLWENYLLEPKFTRSYQIDGEEGIYDIVPYAEDILYIAKSGKLFMASEGDTEPTEIYPARELDRVMYPMFVDVRDENIVVGEQESGDIISLDADTGETAILKRGTEPFSGNSSHTPVDILAMSMEDVTNFMAIVGNTAEDGYALLITTAGSTIEVSNLSNGIIYNFTNFMFWLILAIVIAFAIMWAVTVFIHRVKESKTILAKLSLTTIPFLMITLALFGAFSYYSNKLTVVESSEKQVVDEGNLLAALFGAEIFDEMEYPYDYTTDAYSYLIGQISTRTTYTRTAYYEREALFTGVDFDAPLFYPFEIGMSVDATNLYMDAVRTGVAQTGIINDKNGVRLSCVTPVGGISGGTVYLIETGIPYYTIDESSNSFLVVYIIVAILFLVLIAISLNKIFKSVINPIGRIQHGLEEFSRGNTAIRIETESSDELSDIVKVFNNMASDIDLRMYDLQAASETYYRFIPQKVFALLGKDSLGEINLGNSKESVYTTLTVSLKIGNSASTNSLQEVTNSCYNIISEACEKHGATLVADSVNLRRLQIVCQGGGNSAIDIALTSLSKIDSVNAKLPMQSTVKALFVVHKAKVYYGIFGDEQRFVPALISKELDYIAESEELFWEFTTRLIVTSAAFDSIEKENYFYRYIGELVDTQRNDYKLYDFYDASTTGETHLINETKATFDKAMELYTAKRYYEAKNLFAIVLRENQYDNVARHYIFKCERNL